MDQLDLQIINLLQEDGRIPFTHIAKMTGVAESTIRSRYADLVEQGVVRTIAVINPISVGFNTSALIGILINPGKKKSVAESLMSLNEVSNIFLTLGGFDFVVGVYCRDHNHLTELITEQIQAVDGVRSTETMVIGKIYKENYSWNPDLIT